MKKQKIEKRVLVAIDGSFNAFRAVEYVATIFKEDPAFKISVVYVMPPLPPILYERSEDIDLVDWQQSLLGHKAYDQLWSTNLLLIFPHPP